MLHHDYMKQDETLFTLFCKNHPGTIFQDVSIEDKNIFGKNSKNRKINFVRIKNSERAIVLNFSNCEERFMALIKGQFEIEIVEMRNSLTRLVIGQLAASEYMFKKKYKVKKVIKTILYHKGDETLEMFCKDSKINLVKY